MADDAGGTNKEAERVSGADDETSDRPGFGFFEDVGEFGEPFGLVDGDALGGAEATGGDTKNGVGQLVEPVAYFPGWPCR
jgi:hypothetical protein